MTGGKMLFNCAGARKLRRLPEQRGHEGQGATFTPPGSPDTTSVSPIWSDGGRGRQGPVYRN